VLAALYAGGIAAVLAVGSAGTPITVGAGTWVCAVAGLAFLAAGVWVRVRAASVRVPGTHRAAPPADRS
jgi:hypothetical protein